MTKTIEIADETAQAVTALAQASGRSEADVVTDAVFHVVDLETRRTELRDEITRRLDDEQPSIDGETVFAELRAMHTARFGKV
jgi:predicted transcriptional regulator